MQCSSVGTGPSSIVTRSDNQLLIERQRLANVKNEFNAEKNRIAGEVNELVKEWIMESSRVLSSAEKVVPTKGAFPCRLSDGNLEVYFYIYEDKMLDNIPENLNEMIESLEGTVLAAYEFFLNRLVIDFNSVENKLLNSYSGVIKDIEKIKDLKNSNVFKTASLTMVDIISELPEKSYMLNDDTCSWWK